MFQSMLVLWYQVGDILSQQPAGIVAQYKGGSLFIGAMNGELFMFDSPNLDSGSHDWSLFQPDNLNGIGESDLKEIRDHLQAWLNNPTYEDPVSPEAISAAITYNFSDPYTQTQWALDGSVRN